MTDAPNKPNYFAGLEGLRGLTATYVVIHHVWGFAPTVKFSPWMFPMRFGLEAVLVFFILSGFVISHSMEKSDHPNWPRYAALRIRRIFPIFLLGLLLSYLTISFSLGAFWYPEWWNLFANLLMLQDINKPGIWADPFGGNGPLWSLSYEMWFYALYMLVMIKVSLKCQLATVSVISYLSIISGHFFPNAISNFGSLFLIWWAGVEMARQLRDKGGITFAEQIKPILAMLPAIVWFTWLSYGRWTNREISPIYLASHPFLEMRMFGFAVIVCIAIPLVTHIKWMYSILECRLLLFLGNISYALYVFHIPIMKMEMDNVPFFVSVPLKALLILALAWLAESRFQKWVNARSDRYVSSLGA